MIQGPVNDAIVLRLPQHGTKTVESTQTESYVHHLDVFIFKADADNAKGKRVHYKRYELNNSSSLTLECKRTEFAPEDRFYVYLVANASFSEEELAAQETYYELQHNRQVDDYIHHCGLTSPNAPQYFLMDALATNERGENPIQLNDRGTIGQQRSRLGAVLVLGLGDIQLQQPIRGNLQRLCDPQENINAKALLAPLNVTDIGHG